MSKKIKTLLRTVVFVLLFCLLLFYVQDILTPDHDWPNISRRTTKGLAGYQREPKNTIEIVWAGTSHMMYGVSPMEIYRRTGIASYNLGSIGQNLPETYYLLKLAFERQSPSIVVIDSSSLYMNEQRANARGIWQEMIDCIPWSQIDNKVDMALGYAGLNDKQNDIEYVLTRVFPIMRYHADYTKINKLSFLDLHLDQLYQRKGFTTEAKMNPFNTSKAKAVDKLLVNEFENTETNEPNPVIAEDLNFNLEWLNKILDLCKANDCELVLTKIPVHATTKYKGYWSLEKHNLLQKTADELGIAFVDLVFEEGVGMDWSADVTDTAAHMNYHGAMKVSAFLADWLKEHYDTEAMSKGYDKQSWDKQLEYYDWEMAFFEQEMITDPVKYLESLEPFNYTLFVSVSGDVTSHWTDEAQAVFSRVTGSTMDLRSGDASAYVSVSSHGQLIAEAADLDKAKLSGTTDDGKEYKLSSEYGDTQTGSIKIDDVEMATTDPGIRFVLYDNDLNCVVDSVWFYEDQMEIVAKHKNRNYVPKMRLALIDSAARAIEAM